MHIAFVGLTIIIAFCSGCSNKTTESPKQQPIVSPSPITLVMQAPTSDISKQTQSYWDQCIKVNKQFVTDKSEVWFKEFRPSTVSGTCRDAAKRLREIDNTGVDPEVIDHVNRVIRGFEQIGAIAETKGKESLLQDATATVAFIIKIAKAAKALGAVADGGSLAMGIGASKQGGKTANEGQDQTVGIATKLMDSEEQTISHVRKTYGIELRPW